jgi:hypothetical protein
VATREITCSIVGSEDEGESFVFGQIAGELEVAVVLGV